MPVDYASILNEGIKAQDSPMNAYESAVKLRQQTQAHQQDTAYKAQEIAASQARAQLAQTENDQKQRQIKGEQTLAEAIAKNTTYDENGTPSTNYVAVHKHLNDNGFADLGTKADDSYVKGVKDRLEVTQKNAEFAGSQLGSVETPDWNDQNSILRAQEQYNRAITAAQQAGALTPQSAAQLRQSNVNYTPETEAQRQQLLRQAIPKVTEQATYANTVLDNIHKHRMYPAEEATAGANAQKAQIGVAGDLLGAGAAPPDSGYPTGSASGPYGGAAAGGYPVNPPPAAAAPAQATPQAVGAAFNPNSPTGDADMPPVNPPPAAGTPAQTVPASQAQAPVPTRTAPQQGQPTTAPGTPALGSTPAPQSVPDRLPPNAEADAATRQFYKDHPNRRPLDEKYDTPLTPAQEAQFQVWKAKYAPNDTGEDYDLRGAFKAGVKPDADRGHFPDTFKKPSHPTFSDESQYHGQNGNVGGHWGDDGTFTPGTTNLKNHSPAELQQYFKQNEPDTKLTLPGAAPVKNADGSKHWTQDELDAWRSSPSVSTIKGSIPAKPGPAADAIMAKLGLTKQQQIQDAKVGDKSRDEISELNLWGRKLSAAARQGPGAYTRALDAAPDNIKKLAPDPDKWDPEKTPKQVAALGETSAQQETDFKPPKALPGGMSEAQYRGWTEKHDALQVKEQDQWKSVGEIGDVLNTKDGASFRDPKTGKSVDMDPTQRAHWQKEYEAARTKATEYQQQARQIRSRLGGPTGSGQPTETPSAAPEATPAAAPPLSKLKEGVATRFNNGQIWTIKNGKATQLAAR